MSPDIDDVAGMGPAWHVDEVGKFFDAYHTHGKDWELIAQFVGTRTANNCQAVYVNNSGFLSIPRKLQSKEALVAIMKDEYCRKSSGRVRETPENDSGKQSPEPANTQGTDASAPAPTSELSAEPRGGRHGSQAPAHAPQPTNRGRRTTGRRPKPTAKMKAQLEKAKSGHAAPASAPAEHRVSGRGRSQATLSRKVVTEGPQGHVTRTYSTDDLKGSRKRLFSIKEEEAQTSSPRKRSRGGGKGIGISEGRGRARGKGHSGPDLEKDQDADDTEGVDLLMELANMAMDATSNVRDDARDHDSKEDLHSGGPGVKKELHQKTQQRTPGSHSKSEQGAQQGVGGQLSKAGGRPPHPPIRDLTKIQMEGKGLMSSDMAPVKAIRRKRKPGPERPPLGLSPMKGPGSLGRRCFNTGAISIVAAAMGPYAKKPEVPEAAVVSSAATAERRLRLVLASPRVRRWVLAEWFYSSIDRPWFMRNELQEFLDHVGLQSCKHRLSRPERVCLRSALGKPRRLSLSFLRQQRANLEAYRQAVRSRYEHLLESEVTPELPRPISVGQRVFAIHPATRMLHDGSVLTVENNSARVQFDQQQLGVELVQDVNLAAADPLENLPAVLSNMYQMAGLQPPVGAGGTHNNMACLGTHEGMLEPEASGRLAIKSEPDTEIAVDTYSRDIPGEEAQSLLVQVTSCLDKKESLLLQLRALAKTFDLDEDSVDNESLRRGYTHVLLQMSEVNAELQPAMARLRDTCASHLTIALQTQEASVSAELRRLGINMPPVDATAGCSENAILSAPVPGGPGGADGSRWSAAASRQLVMAKAAGLIEETVQGHQKETFKDHNLLDREGKPEGRWLSSLVTSCIGLLMQTQSMSESHVSRAAVDAVLDPAAAALLPRCESNLPLFKQIQSQIAALKEQLSCSNVY